MAKKETMKVIVILLLLFILGCSETKYKEFIKAVGLQQKEKTRHIVLSGKYAKCEIEYFPTEKRYYPKYEGKYFWYESWRLVPISAHSKFAMDSIGAIKIFDDYFIAGPDTGKYSEYGKVNTSVEFKKDNN